MPPEKYDYLDTEPNKNNPELKKIWQSCDEYQKYIIIRANLQSIIDEAFYTRSQSIDHRIQEELVNYIVD
jgi:hypothetical protein